MASDHVDGSLIQNAVATGKDFARDLPWIMLNVAGIDLVWGDEAKAVEALKLAVGYDKGYLRWIKSDPRFKGLLKKIK